MDSEWESKEATITALNYSQRFRISCAIIWPHFAGLGAIALVFFLLVFTIKKIEPIILNFIAPTIILLFPPLFLTPWAVRRAMLRSYQGFHFHVVRTVDPTKPLTHTDWMAPAWLWLWRNWIIMFLLSPLTKVRVLAVIPAIVFFFIVSPWVVGKLIERKYATTLHFSIHPN